jgi:hypothetical protein
MCWFFDPKQGNAWVLVIITGLVCGTATASAGDPQMLHHNGKAASSLNSHCTPIVLVLYCIEVQIGPAGPLATQ